MASMIKKGMVKVKMMIQVLLVILISCCWFLVGCRGQADADYPSILGPMEKKEQEALYSSIQGFVGNSWNGSDLYPDPCGWTPIQGVSCDLFNDYWYVTTMSIGPVVDNSLSCTNNAKFTPHLLKLSHLKSLSFFNCFLNSTTKIPTSSTTWGKLSNTLEFLEFRSNPGLIGPIPPTIALLTHLQSLVLLENGLSRNLPMELGKLVSLKRLVLAGNRFSGPIPESFGVLSELLILDCSRNFLSGMVPLTFGGLTSLLKLDLSNNMLEGKLPEEMRSLGNLTLLDLGGNNLSGGLVQSIQEMGSLQEMVMCNNPKLGGDLMGIEWEKMHKLEILDLSNTGLVGGIPDSMTELGKLRYLGLSDNNLSGTPPSGIATLPNMGSLYLNGNDFSGKLEFPPGFLMRMGRRFRGWKNPNLCYDNHHQSVSRNQYHSPYGVKPCQQEK